MLMLILEILALENVVISCILYPPCIYNTLTNIFCYLKFHLKQVYIKKVVTFTNFFRCLYGATERKRNADTVST